MNRKLIWRYSVPIFILLVAACNSPIGNKNGALIFKDASGRVITREPLITWTPSPTPTPITETGKGEILHVTVVNYTDFTQGVLQSTVNGVIPFSIVHNAKRGVWEVKGSSIGEGITEYDTSKPAKVHCKATWNVELTLSGILVPFNELIADKEGCWMQVGIVEEWKKIEGSCSTNLGTASGLVDEVDGNTHGPLKFKLYNGFEVKQLAPNLTSLWRLQNLVLPSGIGCAGLGPP